VSEFETQGQKPKTSKLALASVLLAVLGFLVLPFALSFALPASKPVIFYRNMSFLPALFGFTFGTIALFKIRKYSGMLRGGGFAIVGTALSIICLGIWLENQLLLDVGRGRFSCTRNLSHIGKALIIYNTDYGQYPPANKWCDLLLDNGYVKKEQLICPKVVLYWPFVGHKTEPMLVLPFAKKGRCSYAMNPNCKPNSSPDTVLLFESQYGWNLYGGVEKLSLENHNYDGCNILYNDYHVKFERIPSEMDWGDKQGNR